MMNDKIAENEKVAILIVEDSPTQAEELKYLLEKKGFHVYAAANGREALTLLGRRIFNIVISDVLMPEVDGYELCKMMRADERFKHIPVILVTTLSDPKDVIKGLECGANNFIVKPYDEKYLVSRIQYLLVNLALREDTRAEMGINVFFSGENYHITAERLQILDLLLSTYENAYQQNCELLKVQGDLKELNELLERKVEERTASLRIENAERKRAEEEISRVNRTLRTLTECNQALVRFTDESLLVNDVCRIIKEFGGYRAVLVGYAEQNEAKTTRIVAQAGYEEGFPEAASIIRADNEAGYGPICSAIRSRAISIFKNVDSDDRYPALWRAAALKRGYASAIGLPLTTNSDIVGALAIYSAEPDAFHEEEVNLLTELANDLSYGINTLRMRISHKLAEDDLKRSEFRYRRLFEAARDGILIIDAGTGAILDVNQFMIELLGYSREAYLGKKLWDIGSFRDVLASKAYFQELQLHEYIRYEDLPLQTRDGRVIAVEFVSNVYHVNGNNVAQCNIRDITVRRRTEEELKKHREHLEVLIKERTQEVELQKKEAEDARLQAIEANRAKSDFLSNMSHELRTPMNSILGFSEVLQDELYGKLSDKQKEYVSYINDSGHHLLSLINDVLDLSKVEAGKLERDVSRVPLHAVLSGSLSMMKEGAMKRGIQLSLDIASGAEIDLETDERKLKQIMFNLLSNAVKFTPEGGNVSVRARLLAEYGLRNADCPTSQPSIQGSEKSVQSEILNQKPAVDGTCVEISVSDTGIGIKAGDLDKLFKPFSQVECAYTKAHEGTGLGLALTKRLVEFLGGRIRVESEFGRGSAFTFAIPVQQKGRLTRGGGRGT